MNNLIRGVQRLGGGQTAAAPRNVVTADGLGLAGHTVATDARSAMKLSAVYACVTGMANDLGKLPFYVFDTKSRKKVDHDLDLLLSLRPNAVQTPVELWSMMEAIRLSGGNGVTYIRRDGKLRPVELLCIPQEQCSIKLSDDGYPWYDLRLPYTKDQLLVSGADVLHVMGHSYNGYSGVSVIRHAADTVAAGRSAQQYAAAYYENGGQPSGVLQTDSDLGGYAEIVENGEKKQISKKDAMRREWERLHSGPQNAQRIAILDYGLKYQPISISNRDAQFVEQSALTVEDIARFFGYPLYKLQAGKQSYSSNEQNSIEYVVSNLHPRASMYEDELSYKLLTPRELMQGLRIRINIMAELKGDFTSRAAWYNAMRTNGVYSVNDIRALEDEEDVPGGDTRYASLNYVPLDRFDELSVARNAGGGNE